MNTPPKDDQINFSEAAAIALPPAIGKYWKGQGGTYAGILRDGARQFHIIQCVLPAAHIQAQWGKYGITIPDEFSTTDGAHNTRLILAAEPDNEIASHITALMIDGHDDFHWPAKHELMLCQMNAPEYGTDEFHWSSTQTSARRAWSTGFAHGIQLSSSKSNSYAVRAVRRIPV